MSNKEKAGVSALLLTYNHEEFIEACLQGMIKQAVDFPYEILVHDDASTDGTTEIIRRYASEYPDLIKPIIQTENKYSKDRNFILRELIDRATGKYLAFCEGDDTWTDSNKIRKQYDWMEEHPECSMCTHASLLQDMSSGEIRPFCAFSTEAPALLDIATIAREGEIFHTSSFFYRASIAEAHKDFLTNNLLHDFAIRMFWSTKGYVGYLPDVMSLYRKGTKGSWTSRMKNAAYRKEYYEYAVDILKKVDEYTGHQFTEYIELEIDRRSRI